MNRSLDEDTLGGSTAIDALRSAWPLEADDSGAFI